MMYTCVITCAFVYISYIILLKLSLSIMHQDAKNSKTVNDLILLGPNYEIHEKYNLRRHGRVRYYKLLVHIGCLNFMLDLHVSCYKCIM